MLLKEKNIGVDACWFLGRVNPNYQSIKTIKILLISFVLACLYITLEVTSRTCFVRSTTPRSRFKAVLEIRGDARPIQLTAGKYNLYSYGGMKFLLGSSSIFLLVSGTEPLCLTDCLRLLRRCIWRSASCHVSVDVIENTFQVLVRLDWIAEEMSSFVFSSSIVLSLLLCLSTDQHGSSDWDHLEHYGGDHKQRLVGLFRQNELRVMLVVFTHRTEWTETLCWY